MRISKDFIMREIAGDRVIVPTGSAVMNFNGLIMVNEVGAFLWEKLQEETNLELLTKNVLEEYEVDENTARNDIEEFISKLQEGGILQ
ncbi:PqqD family protein [Alloiococcus sp. CFN-8]|uniref:PqqD family protein n=1 Tax=Alloiococcus sp. CFN-8 TaxID=3416081 RepID=UPI003CF30167